MYFSPIPCFTFMEGGEGGLLCFSLSFCLFPKCLQIHYIELKYIVLYSKGGTSLSSKSYSTLALPLLCLGVTSFTLSFALSSSLFSLAPPPTMLRISTVPLNPLPSSPPYLLIGFALNAGVTFLTVVVWLRITCFTFGNVSTRFPVIVDRRAVPKSGLTSSGRGNWNSFPFTITRT